MPCVSHWIFLTAKLLGSSLFPALSFPATFPMLPLQFPQSLFYILPARQEMTQAVSLGSIHMLLCVQHHKPDFQGSAGCVSWDRKDGCLSQAKGSQASWKAAPRDQPHCITGSRDAVLLQILYPRYSFRTSLVVESQHVQQVSAFVVSSHLQLSLQAAWSRNCTSGSLRHCTNISNLAFCV